MRELFFLFFFLNRCTHHSDSEISFECWEWCFVGVFVHNFQNKSYCVFPIIIITFYNPKNFVLKFQNWMVTENGVLRGAPVPPCGNDEIIIPAENS